MHIICSEKKRPFPDFTLFVTDRLWEEASIPPEDVPEILLGHIQKVAVLLQATCTEWLCWETLLKGSPELPILPIGKDETTGVSCIYTSFLRRGCGGRVGGAYGVCPLSGSQLIIHSLALHLFQKHQEALWVLSSPLHTGRLHLLVQL